MTADKTELTQFLRDIDLFAGLNGGTLTKLSSWVKVVQYPAGSVILKEGSPGESMYIVKSGEVEVRKRDPSTGINFLLSTRGPGTAFGEMSLLMEKPRTATIIALEATTVLTLGRSDFRNLLVQDPEVSLALARMLAQRLDEATKEVGIEYVNLRRLNLDPHVVGLLTQAVIQLHKVVPIAFTRNSVTLAMVNPADLEAFDGVRRFIKDVIIEPVICTEDDFRKFMETTYPQLMNAPATSPKPEPERRTKDTFDQPVQTFEQLVEGLGQVEVQEEQEEKTSVTEIGSGTDEGPVVRLANNVLALGIKKGASDIHIEPQERGLVLRLRIDGDLREEGVLPKKFQLPLTSRLKILATLKIDETRMPQDGRISVKFENRAIDFRVSTVPAKFGERIVMRLLDKSGALVPLQQIFVHEPTLEKVQRIIKEPYGIIYVTGPTGSGKTTTLYSALKEINDPTTNILTAEDPIEYDLAGISQVQTKREIGLDFARILRAFLRQDPDVILVGETRDTETAKIAVEAALTGHLVFTTLHTNDAPGAFTRLEEMGIEPFLMSSSTIGILAQRLAKRICKKCKAPAELDESALRYFGLAKENAPAFYKGSGCGTCNKTGYKGRVGIYEVLVMNDTLRRLVASGAKTEEIREAAVKGGMKTLKDYALFLMTEGLTTFEEVMSNIVVSE